MLFLVFIQMFSYCQTHLWHIYLLIYSSVVLSFSCSVADGDESLKLNRVTFIITFDFCYLDFDTALVFINIVINGIQPEYSWLKENGWPSNTAFTDVLNSPLIDFYLLLKFFNRKNKVDFVYSTKDYIDSAVAKQHPSYPTFVKSRPIYSDNQNSILLKLNQIKLFHFIYDTKKFENKKNQAVWRGNIRNNPNREYFVKNFYNSPLFDIGQTSPKENVPWMKSFMTIKDQLDYKFVSVSYTHLTLPTKA